MEQRTTRARARARRGLAALALFLAAGCAGLDIDDDPGPEALARVRRLSLLVGGRELTDDAWEPVETQLLFGLDWAEEIDGLPVLLEGGLHYSVDEAGSRTPTGERVDLRGRIWDFSAGFLVPFPILSLRLVPYVGAGGAVLLADLETDDDPRTIDDRDTSVGAYAKVGLLFEVSPQAYVGVELRSLRGTDVNLDGSGAEIDHNQVALVLGAGF